MNKEAHERMLRAWDTIKAQYLNGLAIPNNVSINEVADYENKLVYIEMTLKFTRRLHAPGESTIEV